VTAADGTPELFSGPLGVQLRRRLQRAMTEAQELLGIDPGSAPPDELSRLRALIEALGEHPSIAPAQAALQAHEAGLERLRQRFERRSEALARVQAVLAGLREVTSPGAMLARAPMTLCAGSRFTRAILSVVRDARMVPEAAHFAGDAQAAVAVLAELQANPVVLEHPLIENELLRRRRATIVLDAAVHPRVDRRTAELMRWRSYAAAPLVVGANVIGVIHADRGPELELDVLDRDVLWEFATGLAQSYESASLRRTLRREREQMREFLEWCGARSGALTDAPITLAPSEPAPLPGGAPNDADGVAEPLAGADPAAGRDDRVVFAGLLTRRELDVLRLLAEGSTNRAVADELVLSEATVKFHVNSILRKLRAANRAEAVARYLALLGMSPP
jgi:LuxR family transcriptional regulator, regulator of acetate metabolism